MASKRYTQAELKKMGKEAASLYTKLRNILAETVEQDGVTFYAYFEEGCSSKTEFLENSGFSLDYQPPKPPRKNLTIVKEKGLD